ncbi:MAG: tetratricopeptide repeat protein [Thermodesulfobacteriota bacterium]|nr:tetratricopeptide repeat protein [Thermodesulfobacteriota bacterium]
MDKNRMNEHSAFSKRHIEEVTQAKRTLLDELNFPPAVTAFIRKNSRSLQIIVICIFAGICLWSFFDYYTTKQKNDSAALLSRAMAESDDASRQQLLKQVRVEYSGTGAAVWSQVVSAHEMMESDRDQAISILKSLADGMSSSNPLLPLLQFDLGQAHEMNGNPDQALGYYQKLSEIKGFSAVSFLAMGRIYEQKNEPQKAKEMYEKAVAQPELPSTAKSRIEDKLSRL